MTETGSRLLLGVAAVLAGTAVLLAVFGLVYNPVLLLAAVPFGAATYFLWSSATGRLDARMRERVDYRRAEGDGLAGDRGSPWPGDAGGGRWTRGPGTGPGRPGDDSAGSGRGYRGSLREPTLSRTAAASVLEVDPAADEAEVRRAFREKARELHPDAPGGDQAAFRRVRTAYERLRDGR